MSEIVWEDPPNPGKAAGRDPVWIERLRPFRERPGQWGKLGRYVAEAAYKINAGNYAGIQAGEYQAVGRNYDKDTRTADIYVRYVGKPNLKSAAS